MIRIHVEYTNRYHAEAINNYTWKIPFLLHDKNI